MGVCSVVLLCAGVLSVLPVQTAELRRALSQGGRNSYLSENFVGNYDAAARETRPRHRSKRWSTSTSTSSRQLFIPVYQRRPSTNNMMVVVPSSGMNTMGNMGSWGTMGNSGNTGTVMMVVPNNGGGGMMRHHHPMMSGFPSTGIMTGFPSTGGYKTGFPSTGFPSSGVWMSGFPSSGSYKTSFPSFPSTGGYLTSFPSSGYSSFPSSGYSGFPSSGYSSFPSSGGFKTGYPTTGVVLGGGGYSGGLGGFYGGSSKGYSSGYGTSGYSGYSGYGGSSQPTSYVKQVTYYPAPSGNTGFIGGGMID